MMRATRRPILAALLRAACCTDAFKAT